MELDLAPGLEDFREEVRTWFAEHIVGEFAAHRGVGSPTDDTAWDLRVEWERELSQGRWLGLTWPEEYGGRGLGLAEEIVFEYEYARAAAPARVNTQALELLGPTLLACGTHDQKLRFLPKILKVEEMWGQGFSEPGAGSDLAGVRTRAVLGDDGVWHIDGQKIWTTFGHHADWLYVLCRTNPDASLRHKGLSLLLVDAHQEGVDVRPIENINRSTEFSECFFNDARSTVDLTVGEIDGGWSVVMTTLGLERGSALMPVQLGMERELGSIIDIARRNGSLDDPDIRCRLVDAYIGIKLMRSTNLRVVADLLNEDSPDPGAATAAAAMTTKLFASTHHQKMGELAMDIVGSASMVETGDAFDDVSIVQKLFLSSRAETIYGGTSEIQRNIAAERVLGLPR
ncbi:MULTISPECIES: acyl-CoA dehydrogenase family protein [Rhodococcus]|uniref:Acyl-CoA dehydrogenase family protein n=1 Tax=Rhodococcus oxybenzonivorans TaxID=1990687 RepID=A0AAE4V0H0_9NOCA|nr:MULTISPECIES: acyl-CoA dehydrogenase family protein [Rhodococcus]MDV7241873.1 acyl-CoA dehydrogenase family protein [Rhodococcus oxybenzonivorans]MDV7265473.1 acyl-CoA dehydrogenase family protein [Rhodococcus oxybenzonivorans]MDV7273593.1 acyl-CoA dehydrogenase family protein [Rhodococcus oxybenzonivorans]MDV7334155.1 acyl-CoA dehydrogenase family protein [Rhodococcus oxybenzonivorans]MDV7343574.1 acyl-CoA dehydrogenase family protein [Rhodococcus oxybenzonivorans]